MGGRKIEIRHQPPHVGEHTWAVLEEAGYAGDEIEDLVEQGIVIAE